jgi:TctA family transporter
MLERSARQALLIGYGDPLVFLTEPISATLIAAAALVLVGPVVMRMIRAARR